MGRKWKRNRKNKHTGEGKPRKAADPSNPKYGQERNPYKMIEGGNYKMESYYAYQGTHDHYLDSESGTFIKCETSEQKEEERIRWLASMKSILPASFRIGNDVDPTLRERLEKDLEEYVGKKMELEVLPKGGERRIQELDLKAETKMIAPAKKIQFIPYGYQLSLDRGTIRRNKSLNPFHEWLKVQTEAGFVTRQETVSMIPPVVLNPERHHTVLDMCAAPGSKTSQLLEILNLPANPNDTEPTGCVIANDSDLKRAYMLVHQLRRINSPAVFVTSCDAQFFPMLKSDKKAPTEGNFDRVLCDVPCSGDGTSRKNPGVWKKWNALNAYGLHSLQLSIALKGARLTRVGGYMCYSTCSLNPIENESVVAELLRASEGSLELVDRRSELPGLLARPGLSSWKVLSEPKSRRQIKDKLKKNNAKMQARRKEWEEKNGTGEKADSENQEKTDAKMGKEDTVEDHLPQLVSIHTEFKPESMTEDVLKEMTKMVGMDEYQKFEDVPWNMQRRLRKSCFPPTSEEASRFHLERCMRVLPHDMDTGGFFVALLKKVAPMSPSARKIFLELEAELQEEEEGIHPNEEPKSKKARVEVEGSKAQGNEIESGKTGTQTSGTVEYLPNEKDNSAVVRGHVKKTYLVGKDGKKHATLGRDDFIPARKELLQPLKDYYGLTAGGFDFEQYMCRACGDEKVLYFLTKTVKGLVNEGIQERVTVVTSGVKAFVRNNKECEVAHRISQEGVHFVAPHMTKRKFGIDLEDFKKCLQEKPIPIESLSDGFAQLVRPLSMGSFVAYLNGFENDYIKKFMIVLWRCRGDNLNCLVSRAELDGMRSKVRSVLGEDTVGSSQ